VRVAASGQRQLVAGHARHLAQLLVARLHRAGDAVAARERALAHLSPTRVLARGYSITTVEGSATPLRDAAAVRPGQVLHTTLAHGRLRSLVARETPAASARTASVDDAQPSLFAPPSLAPPDPTEEP
jgi:exonuclease VII large subunit